MEANNQQKQCKHCKEMVNKDAKRCPKCQWDLRSWFARNPIWTLVLFTILLVSAIWAFNDDTSTPTIWTSTTVSEKTEEQKAFDDLKSQIQVSGYVDSEYWFAHAYLKIKNNTNHPIDLFAFEATLYNNAGEVQKQSISRDDTFVWQSQELLAPGKTVNWSWQLVWFDHATKIGNITIRKLHLKDTGKTYQ